MKTDFETLDEFMEYIEPVLLDEEDPEDDYGHLNNSTSSVNDDDDDDIKNRHNHLPQKLASRMISMTTNYPKIDFLIIKDGIGCVSSGDIIVIKGKAKEGKTHVLICFISVLLKGEYMGLQAIKQGLKVLFADTEQNPMNTAIFVKKVHAICGFPEDEDNPRFHAFNLRGDNPEVSCSLIRQAVEYFKPDVLVIDGVKDLIKGLNINDPEESGATVQFLMTLTHDFNIAVLTTLHENKSLNDSNLRGHIGTELANKSSECWQVKKVGDIFESEQTECRNEPATGFSFTFNEEKLPVPAENISGDSDLKTKYQKMKDIFAKCFSTSLNFRYSELKTKYIEISSCSETTAENHISKAVKFQYLTKDEKGNYSLNYLTL